MEKGKIFFLSYLNVVMMLFWVSVYVRFFLGEKYYGVCVSLVFDIIVVIGNCKVINGLCILVMIVDNICV